MNKAFVWLLVIVGGGVAGWYFLHGGTVPSIGQKVDTSMTPSISPQAQDQPQSDTGTDTTAAGTSKGGIVNVSTVTYADSGFSPAKITVKKGTTVSFENKSSGSVWVASDVHPTHLLLPGFDAKKGMVSGSVYQYTFAKVGTWTYHDHLHPTQVGVVIVTE
jgi:plastocyanin